MKKEKSCKKCGEKDLSKFRLMKGKYYGPKCYACEKIDARERRKAKYHNPETQNIIKQQNKNYSSKPERVVLVKQINKERYENNREQIKERTCKYRQIPENKARRNALWRERYVEEASERRHEFKEKYHSDPVFRLRGNIRSRIWEALKKDGGSKNSSVLKALDYPLEELKFHIEQQFTDEMSWDDTKSFTIDHIIPRSMFWFQDLSDKQFRLCWSLDNLRPLPPSQNFSEGNRQHLFGDCDTWDKLAQQIKKWGPGSKVEDLHEIKEILGNFTIEKNIIPYNNVGIGYLDRIFSHRFDSNSNGKKSLNRCYHDEFFILKVCAYIVSTNRPISKNLFYRNASFFSKTPAHFFPSVAASLINEYAKGGQIFDPFLGWGGRTLGALCTGASSICGTDLQQKSVDGCKQLASHFPEVDSEFICQDFREYISTTSRKFDCLITSPPFMDTENYGSESFSDPESWSQNIIFPLVSGAKKIIKKGGYIIIHGQERRKLPVLSLLRLGFSSAGYEYVTEYNYGKSRNQKILIFRCP